MNKLQRPIWITTDTHLNHSMLWQRGYRPEDFEARIARGLATIPEEAIFIHLGDVCIGLDEQMHGFIHDYVAASSRILVLGNHDHKSDSWYYNHGWDFVCEWFVVDRYGIKVAFSHEPLNMAWSRNGVGLNIHGHTHGNGHRDPDVGSYLDPRFHIELALEHNDYRPWLFSPKLLDQAAAPLGGS